MKALRVKLYQELVNYRKPLSYNFLESFPLPSFSMIKGWIYNSVNHTDKEVYFNETISDLKISVSGTISGLTHDLQHLIKLNDMNDYEKMQKDLLTRTPTYVTLISSIILNIYIDAGERLLQDFQDNIFRLYPSLGRYEDLANIESCELVELKEIKFSNRKSHKINYYVYISEDKAKEFENIRGSYLRIPTVYEINNNIRNFKRRSVLCLSDNCVITEGTFYYDDADMDDDRIVDFISVV